MPLFDCRVDRLNGPAQRLILVQEDGGGPLGAGLAQGQHRGDGQRIGPLGGEPLLPEKRPAARVNQRLLDHLYGGVAAVTVNFDRLIRAAADDDFLTGVIAEAADGQSLIAVRLERLAAAGVEMGGDRLQGPRPFDQQRGHRPASRRSQQHDGREVLLGHGDILTRPAAKGEGLGAGDTHARRPRPAGSAYDENPLSRPWPPRVRLATLVGMGYLIGTDEAGYGVLGTRP